MIKKMDDKKYPPRQRLKNRLRSSARWLTPGLGVKRWLLLILAGTTLLGVGLGVLILTNLPHCPANLVAANPLDGIPALDRPAAARHHFRRAGFRVDLVGHPGDEPLLDPSLLASRG